MHVQLPQFCSKSASSSCGWKMNLCYCIGYWILCCWMKNLRSLLNMAESCICCWMMNLMSLAEYGWKYIRLGRYTKYRSYLFLPALFIHLSSSEIQCIQWMEIQWMEIGFICYKIWVFKSSMLDGTNLTMWLNVSMSNIARSCWLSGR